MIKFAIPSSRVHEWAVEGGGATNLPAQPRLAGGDAFLVGGASTSSEVNKCFVAVGTSGTPLSFKSKKPTVFQAVSPSSAATKFFNSWWKSTGQGPCSASTLSFDDARATLSKSQLEKKLLVRIAEVGATKSIKNYIVNYVPNEKPNEMQRKTKIVCTSKATRLDPGQARPENLIELESYASF